ncbi:MAG: hypothetical protein ACLQPN_07165 [Bryobacteraceae bacterium]
MRRFLLTLTVFGVCAWSQPGQQQAPFFPQTLVDWAQPILVIVTAVTLGVLWMYTKETVRLREATERQVTVSHDLLREAQVQNEASIRPILQMVASMTHPTFNSTSISYTLRNLGTGPAFNIAVNSVPVPLGVYLFRQPDTLATMEGTDDFHPLMQGQMVEWGDFLWEAQGGERRRPVNIRVQYQNAAGRAYFSHHVIALETGNSAPVTTLLESGPQK